MSGNVLSFVEESCFSGDTFRSVRRNVWFTANFFGKGKFDFLADNGLWYDYSDEYLLSHLKELETDLDWGYFVFFKKIDHSAIHILHPEDQRLVGLIQVRRALGVNPSGEIFGDKVVDLAEYRKKKESESAE